MRALRKLRNDQSGVTAIEFGLIAALISIGIVSAVDQHRTNLSSTFGTIADKL